MVMKERFDDGVQTQIAVISEADAPAGGTGATAGAYDSGAHRDTMIALVNATKAKLNALIAELQALKIIKA